MITPAQSKEGRALLNWSRDRLAPRCGISAEGLRRFETERRDLPAEALATLRSALEAAGVEFTNGGEPGVKLKSRG